MKFKIECEILDAEEIDYAERIINKTANYFIAESIRKFKSMKKQNEH